MSVRACADVGRRTRLLDALARADHARRIVREGAFELALTFTEITDGGPLIGWHDPGDGARRTTGGPPWHLAPGALLGRIALAHASVLMATPKDKILNRNVRPLLAALRKRGVVAMYGGRDFVSADGEIVALLGWARGERGEVAIDVAIGEVLDHSAPEVERAHLGKKGRPIPIDGLGEVIAAAYARDAEAITFDEEAQRVRTAAPPASASTEVAIGRISVHPLPGRIAVRGDLFADDALEALEPALEAAKDDPARLAAIAASVVVEGVVDWPGTLARLIGASR